MGGGCLVLDEEVGRGSLGLDGEVGGYLVLEEDGGCLGLDEEDEEGCSLDSDEAGCLEVGKTGGFAAQ